MSTPALVFERVRDSAEYIGHVRGAIQVFTCRLTRPTSNDATSSASRVVGPAENPPDQLQVKIGKQ
jgi:hypothetical protein